MSRKYYWKKNGRCIIYRYYITLQYLINRILVSSRSTRTNTQYLLLYFSVSLCFKGICSHQVFGVQKRRKCHWSSGYKFILLIFFGKYRQLRILCGFWSLWPCLGYKLKVLNDLNEPKSAPPISHTYTKIRHPCSLFWCWTTNIKRQNYCKKSRV